MLTRALAEHDSAVQRGLRADSGWNKRLRDPLVQARINLRLCRVDQLIQQGASGAESECERLAAEISSQHPGFEDLRGRADRIVAAKARTALERKDFAVVRDLLEGFSGRYPPDSARRAANPGHPGRSRRGDVREAERLKTTAPQKATEQLELAAKIWPRLPGSIRRAAPWIKTTRSFAASTRSFPARFVADGPHGRGAAREFAGVREPGSLGG